LHGFSSDACKRGNATRFRQLNAFDPNVLQPATVAFDTAGTLSGAAGFTITPNTTTSGQVTISGFGTQQPLSGSGTLLFLRFTVVGMAETPTDRTNLTFTSFMFNEGDPAAATTNGSFIVATPTAATVTVTGRVITAQGRGIRNVVVTITDSSGNTRRATTTTFGYYRFDNVAAGFNLYFRGEIKTFQFLCAGFNTNGRFRRAEFYCRRCG